jgi:hypothetical protein
MIFINLIAITAIFVSMAERLSWARFSYIKLSDLDQDMLDLVRSPEYQENTSGYYYILVGFITIFTVILFFAELRNQWARSNFKFLDTKTGRGFFLVFLGLMIP